MCSVLDQGHSALDYIVVDPGSTDGSRALIDFYAPRLGAVLLEKDEGPADGLNRGFERARGEIFGYINADDRLRPGALARVARYFSEHPDVDVLCGAIAIIDQRGKPSMRRRTADRFDLRRYAAGICTIGQQATFFRRAAFEQAGGFRKTNRISWDGELLVDMALTGARFATIPDILGDFRVYSTSMTGSNRFRDALDREQERIALKIEARGIALPRGRKLRLQQVLYQINPARHLRYVLAR